MFLSIKGVPQGRLGTIDDLGVAVFMDLSAKVLGLLVRVLVRRDSKSAVYRVVDYPPLLALAPVARKDSRTPR